MAITGVTETSATALDLISQAVQIELRARAVLLPTLTDYSMELGAGAKSFEVVRYDSLTAEDKAENSALTAQALTAATDSIPLNKHKASLVNLEDIAAIQSVQDIPFQVIQRIASSIVDALEGEAYTVLAGASASAPDHIIPYATPSTLAKADILQARRLLATQNVPMDDGNLFMAIHPNQEEDLLDIANFVQADQYGNPNGVQNGLIGRVFGFNVVMSTKVTANTSLFYHRTHAGYAMQQDIVFKTQDDLENVSTKILGHAIAGFTTLDNGVRGVLVNATGA